MDDKAIYWLVILCLGVLTVVQASTKKGIAGWGGDFMCDDFKRLNNMTWLYDWKLDLSQVYVKHMKHINCPESTYMQYLPEYVPMIWTLTDHPGTAQHYQHYANVSSNAKFILGFNEPDHSDQANMSPQEAANAWPEVERSSHGIPLVSPAPAARNFHWLDSFFHLCKGCRVDYVAAHSYTCSADETMTYLHGLYQRYGKKVWLTEFACPHSTGRNQQLNLMKELLPRLEAADYVFRYSWYSARLDDAPDDGWINADAALFWPHSPYLTSLGHFYNDFQGNGHAAHVIG